MNKNFGVIKMPINASQSEIYESYSMHSPDGEFMCYCNKKKAHWYVNKNLATWVTDKKFQLIFEPNGKGKADNPYYTQEIKNCCVVCGSEKELNKHHVVPYVFRSRLPLQYKESNHHDVLATCIDCHEIYEEKANILKKEIADELNVAMENGMSPEQIKNKKILSAKRLLERINLGEIQGVPKDRIELLKTKASQPLFEDISSNGAAWADEIIKIILSKDELFSFVKRWRTHFVETMKPNFLPEHWSINSPLEKSGRVEEKV